MCVYILYILCECIYIYIYICILCIYIYIIFFSQYIYIYFLFVCVYIYIYSYPLTDCFVISQLFNAPNFTLDFISYRPANKRTTAAGVLKVILLSLTFFTFLP